jgi:hypothetical protein
MSLEAVCERPEAACVTCRPPKNRAWHLAMSGHRTCERCADRLHAQLIEVADRYEALTSVPAPAGSFNDFRCSPGFVSRSPASDHVIVMRDHRSSPEAKVWVGSDGRIHQESIRPPLSVYSTLVIEVYDVVELREVAMPDPRENVRDLTEFLDRHLDWLTRQESVIEFAATLRRLRSQLMPLTGSPRVFLGTCPNEVDEQVCGRSLYIPTGFTYRDTVSCGSCGWEWPPVDWIALGDVLAAS